MPIAPSGTVTFLFTDIEGSTKRWEQFPQAMQVALHRHDHILRIAIEEHEGYIFKTMGDAFCAAFHTPLSALQAAIQAQRALQAEEWPQDIGSVPVRMALHTGMVEQRDEDYFGQPLNRVARLLSAGHGGQVLLSQSIYELVRDGLPPSVQLTDLGEHRLKDLIRPERIFQLVAPGLPSEFSPLKTLDNRPNNLPVQLTPLIGRENEVGAVCSLLLRPEVHLLTLTGPGGTGKTRLGLQAAADVLDDFPDGVWFVGLAALTDPNLVDSTVAQVLGVTEAAGRPLIDSLKEYLRDKRLLLVLDNFEQVLQALTLVDTLLKAAPHLKVLITSRIPLRAYGEKEYPVPPLSLPTIDVPGRPPLRAEGLTQYEAVRLFIERAQDVKPDFQVTNENAPAIAEICVRLDGLPLAIELAAARVRLFAPQALLSRLQSRLKMLTGGARTLPARQQTLRAAIEWSYDLLTEGEKQFFRRMAVFQGGRTLEGLEAVCNADEMLEVDVLAGVESLISNSLLQQREGSDGEPRFWMLETIHEYAREKLEESGEEGEQREYHAIHFTSLVEEAEPELNKSNAAIWYNKLEQEHDNIRAALEWAGRNALDLAIRLCSALWLFWEVRGHYSEGREQLRTILAEAETTNYQPITPLAKAFYAAGYLAMRQGDFIKATQRYEKALATYRQIEDQVGVAMTLKELGTVLGGQGEYSSAYSLLEEGLTIARRLGERYLVSRFLNDIGEVLRYEGKYEEAGQAYEEALAIRRELDNKAAITNALHNLGFVVHRQGDFGRAYEIFREGLIVSQEIGRLMIIAGCLIGLGGTAWSYGQPIKATRLLGAAEVIVKTIGVRLWPPDQVEYERFINGTRQALDDTTWEAAWNEGQAMSMEQAIEYALEEGPQQM